MRVTDGVWPGAMYAPTPGDIATVAESILRELPDPFRSLVASVPVRVEEWPAEELLDELGIEDPLELTGFYAGVPVGERESGIIATGPDMIYLFRMPLLYEWCERGCSLEEVVWDVLTHEIGHHFGMSEEEVLRMEGRGEEPS